MQNDKPVIYAHFFSKMSLKGPSLCILSGILWFTHCFCHFKKGNFFTSMKRCLPWDGLDMELVFISALGWIMNTSTSWKVFSPHLQGSSTASTCMKAYHIQSTLPGNMLWYKPLNGKILVIIIINLSALTYVTFPFSNKLHASPIGKSPIGG